MIHIAIVSHGHEDLLISSQMTGLLHAHLEKSQLRIWVKDNKPAIVLKEFCSTHQIDYIDDKPGLGFGHNNNYLFDVIKEKVGFHNKDIFLVLNPDITIDANTLFAFVEQMQADQHNIASINLYRNQEKTIYDTNIRHFPSLMSLLKLPFTGTMTRTYDKQKIEIIQNQTSQKSFPVDWASGAFLAFTPNHFEALGGFDTSYFMYFEDVDLCFRSKTFFNQAVQYYPQFTAIHSAARKNRDIFSPHSSWFFQSFFQFLIRRYTKSSMKKQRSIRST